MITELGHFALILALLTAVFQASVPLIGANRNDLRWMAAAVPAANMQAFLIAVSFAALTYAYVTSDFSVLNVAKNSHTAKPMLYKISGVWGNHEGSLLLWIFILAIFGSAVATFGRGLPPSLKARVLAVQAMIGVGFLAFILYTSNPFLRLFPAPLNGKGLNPILQDPGLAFHPPFLYLGYVGFSIAFSFAVAALMEGRVDPAWARWVRPWTLAAWVFLTLGIGLGSWWAYYELGWGGWWFWDPVENASFMPWLVGTALLHSVIVVEKRNALKSWTILLAIMTFALSLLGTFLVRSGVLTSVHAFASDPDRGVFILILLLIAVGGSLLLFAVRGSQLKSNNIFAATSRESGLVFNNLLLSAATGTVLLGTLYPLFVDVLNAGKVSVGAPFFNLTFIPMMVPLLVLMTFGPMLTWKRGRLKASLFKLRWVAAVAMVAGAVSWVLTPDGGSLTALGFALAVGLFSSTTLEFLNRIEGFQGSVTSTLKRVANLPRSAYGMTAAHLGVAIIVAGITGASMWQIESIQSLKLGESVAVAGYDFRLESVEEKQGPNYTAQRGKFFVSKDGEKITILEPEKRTYPVEGMPTTEAAIKSNWFGDLYAVVGGKAENGGWVTRIYYKPLLPWLWVGGLMLALGGLLSLSDRRFRLGVPARKSKQSVTDETEVSTQVQEG